MGETCIHRFSTKAKNRPFLPFLKPLPFLPPFLDGCGGARQQCGGAVAHAARRASTQFDPTSDKRPCTMQHLPIWRLVRGRCFPTCETQEQCFFSEAQNICFSLFYFGRPPYPAHLFFTLFFFDGKKHTVFAVLFLGLAVFHM